MAAPLFTFTVRDAATIRNDWLRLVSYGLKRRGVAEPEVGAGSEMFIRAQGFANEAEIAEANAVIKCDEFMDDTATGEALERRCKPYDIFRRPAGPSAGFIVFDASAPSLVTTLHELTDQTGQRYVVTVGGTYDDEEPIAIASRTTGVDVNLPAGTVLRWVNSPTYSSEKALVSAGGLINGRPREEDESLRGRLFEHKRSPPASGNAQDLCEMAEKGLLQVQKAYCYQAIQGSGTVHMALTAAPTATNKNRSIATATMTSLVRPYIQGKIPGRAYSIVTTVTDQECDLAIGITIPEALTASPPGPGGGWVDGSTWPLAGVAGHGVLVSSVTSTTVITVDATTAPNAGVSHISWLSPIDWKIYSAVVVSSAGTTGAYVLTLDNPLVGITAGSLIWPSFETSEDYVDAILAFFELMGPGEKTSNVSALVRGYRHPRPSASWPSALGASLLSALKHANPDELTDAQYVSRYDDTTYTVGNSGDIAPAIPASVEDPPSQFVPRHLGFYRL